MSTSDTAKSHWWNDPAARRAIGIAARGAAAAVPVVLVNAVAFSGQFAFLRAHLHWVLPGQVMAALALESIAVYLAFHAHLAQLANDSALRLRLGSYVFAAIIGAMNYSHYAVRGWHPTVPAVMLGMMSLLSPWLWAIHSRRASRDKLMARGLVEEHAVRLGATRWTWHPFRSVQVMHRATWHGENDPKRAIDALAHKYGTPELVQLAQDQLRAIPAPPAVLDLAPVPSPEPVPAEPAAAVPAVPAAISASANLTAEATLPATSKRPAQEVITAAELRLAGTPIDQLPSIRRIAEDMLGDPNQRRLAARLRESRKAAETQKQDAPAGETVQGTAPVPSRPARSGGPIAWPQGFQAGGGAAVSG
jgi:hypothetical protein